MQISVTFRQLEPSEALKSYVSDRLKKFKRYLEGPLEAHVVLGLEKFRNLADITIYSNGRIIKGREENSDMYAAIDLVVDKIDMQLRKHRDRLREVKADRSRPRRRRLRKWMKPRPCPPFAANGLRCRPLNWPTPWNYSKPRALTCWCSPMSIPGPCPSCIDAATAAWPWPSRFWGRTPHPHEAH
jgi:ribosomal subunit interface protein